MKPSKRKAKLRGREVERDMERGGRGPCQLSPWIEPSKLPNFRSQEIPFLLKQVYIGFLSH